MHIYVRTLIICTCIVQICHGMDDDEQPQALSSITAITSFNQASQALDAADKDTLVLFDVDETLVNFASSLVIEPSIIERIGNLQSQKITTIALTGIRTGPSSTISSLERWRYEKLKELGIDFNKTHFHNEEWILRAQGTCYKPAFYNGVLVTDHGEKGPVLKQFLEKQKYTPQRIIFFDDQLRMLESVQATASALSIDFQGFHYNGSSHLPLSFITRINSFDQANKVLDAADENTLIIFDADRSLHLYENVPTRALLKKLSPYERMIYLKYASTIAIKSVVDRIKELQKKSRVIAISSVANNSEPPLGWMPQWLYDSFMKDGIDFKTNSIDSKIELTSENDSRNPVFYNGILVTDCVGNDKALLKLMEHWKKDKKCTREPSRIIYFDDDKNRIRDVALALRSHRVNFIGFIYNGADHVQWYQDDETDKIIEFQIKHLKLNDIWLLKEDARDLRNRQIARISLMEQIKALNSSQSSDHDKQDAQFFQDNDPAPLQPESIPNRPSKWRRFLSKWCCCKSRQDDQITPTESQLTEKN